MVLHATLKENIISSDEIAVGILLICYFVGLFLTKPLNYKNFSIPNLSQLLRSYMSFKST